MIGITQNNTILNVEINAVHYTESIEKHRLTFKYFGGEINILIDNAEFGNFMKQVVDSYCESVKHSVDKMKKENTK
jgi:hypothetical protein